ncbi:S41 family peptidase [Candidatus Omnitrophota bacterium]
MLKQFKKYILITLVLLTLAWGYALHAAVVTEVELTPPAEDVPEYYKPYLQLLEEVYEKMDQYYYQPVSKKVYEVYVQKYKRSVLSKVKKTDERVDRIAYIGAGLLVNHLKDRSEDSFTNFIPPKEAKEYAQKIYGYENGIGITGALIKDGYLINHVQIRSDAHRKGIEVGDVVRAIDSNDVTLLSEEELHNLLYPPLETIVKLEVFSPIKNLTSLYEVICEEYFKETIRNIPTDIPGVYCLKIQTFNRETANDFKQYIADFLNQGIELLIIDVVDNPGGPPLAVNEISGVLTPTDTKLVYYKKKNQDPIGLIAPESNVHYTGPLIILVNKQSGSASEILAGTMKGLKRALIIGKEPTAGKAFLKSAFTFDDGSMLAMVTGLAYLFDGTKFGMDGIEPNITITTDKDNLLQIVLQKYQNGELSLLQLPLPQTNQ